MARRKGYRDNEDDYDKPKKKKKGKKKRSYGMNVFLDVLKMLGIVFSLYLILMLNNKMIVGFSDLIIAVILLRLSITFFMKAFKAKKDKTASSSLSAVFGTILMLLTIMASIFPIQILVSNPVSMRVIFSNSSYVEDSGFLITDDYVKITDVNLDAYKVFNEGPFTRLTTGDFVYETLDVTFKSTIKGNVVIDYSFVY